MVVGWKQWCKETGLVVAGLVHVSLLLLSSLLSSASHFSRLSFVLSSMVVWSALERVGLLYGLLTDVGEEVEESTRSNSAHFRASVLSFAGLASSSL